MELISLDCRVGDARLGALRVLLSPLERAHRAMCWLVAAGAKIRGSSRGSANFCREILAMPMEAGGERRVVSQFEIWAVP